MILELQCKEKDFVFNCKILAGKSLLSYHTAFSFFSKISGNDIFHTEIRSWNIRFRFDNMYCSYFME